jgi:hypothetical protein
MTWRSLPWDTADRSRERCVSPNMRVVYERVRNHWPLCAKCRRAPAMHKHVGGDLTRLRCKSCHEMDCRLRRLR